MYTLLSFPPKRTTTLRLAGAATVTGHFTEIVQGAFRHDDGAIVRGLVTVRCPRFWSKVGFEGHSEPGLTVSPDHCVLNPEQAAH